MAEKMSAPDKKEELLQASGGEDPTQDDSDEGYVDREDDAVIVLKDGVDLKDLQRDGTSFEVSRIDSNVTDNQYFPDESVYKVFSGDLDMDDAESASGSDAEKDDLAGDPYERLARKMENVLEDGGVKKLICKPGSGSVVPPRNLVTVHYNGYQEYGDEAFDSTRARGKPLTFYLGSGEVVPALDIAVGTMKKGETSKFLFQPEYFLGSRGCPPRIPADSPVMFVIDLINYVECAGVDDFYRMPMHERKEADFNIIKKVVKKDRETGINHFKDKRIPQAIKSFRQAIKTLEDYHLKDEKEQDEQQKVLLHLYQNMGLCHLQKAECGSAIRYANNALSIDPGSPKAHYIKAKALRKQADFAGARRCIKHAQTLCPTSADIIGELKQLNIDVEKFEAAEAQFCKRMFNSTSAKVQEMEANKENTRALESCSQEFRTLVEERLLEAKNDPTIIEFPFPPTKLSTEEIECIESVAKKLDLIVSKRGQGNEVTIKIRKPNPDC